MASFRPPRRMSDVCTVQSRPFIEVIAKPAQDPGRRRVTHVTMDTNAEGRASIKLLKSGLAHFPYGKPFAQLDCDSCEPSFVHLTAEAGAEIVHQAARKRDIEACLTEHRGHPSTELLDGQLEQMAAHERALRKVKPSCVE